MVDILKNWITTMLCIGIFLTFIQMIVPNTNLKKYIYSLIGVVTIITLILPAYNYFKVNKLDEVTTSVINSLNENVQVGDDIASQRYSDISKNENVKNEFIKKYKEDIIKKLQEKGIEASDVVIIIDDEYNVEKLNIKINGNNISNTNINKIFSCISENYDIDKSKVSVEEV